MNDMTDDEFFMLEALKLSEIAEQNDEVPIGAVLVADDKVIGRGWNCPISSSDPTAHAEVIAMRDAAKHFNNYRLPETTLYVTLEPCVMCVGALIHARIKRLVFGAFDSKTGAVVSVFRLLDSVNHNHRVEYEGGILQAECGSLLINFFKSKR